MFHKKNIIFSFVLAMLLLFVGIGIIKADSHLADSLSGRILLQVEENGEAWYVEPKTKERTFLGRPDDAFSVMKEQGIGITNNDLMKVSPSLDYLSGLDSDRDGLPDDFEVAFGTDPNKSDTDGDSYNDYREIMNGYNPLGSGKLLFNENFTSSQSGKILLQVESNGEAWYVNPENHKRYFLGRPADAFQVMRNLGLGISNENLNKINKKLVETVSLDCGSIEYADMANLMFADDESYLNNEMSAESKNALTCINQAMTTCSPATFKVESTTTNPFVQDDEDFLTPNMFLTIKGEEDSNTCKINNCLIPRESISNHYTTNGESFIFTLVGFSPQGETSQIGNNDLYDPVTEEIFNGVCPLGDGIFSED